MITKKKVDPQGTVKSLVLIVEDDDLQARLLNDILHRCGHECFIATSLSSALKILESDPRIHVVLTDYSLGDGCGINLISAFRQMQPHNDWTEFILFTGHASLEVARLAIAQGVRQLLIKPIADTELDTAVSEAMKAASMKRQREISERGLAMTLFEIRSKVGLLIESGSIRPPALSRPKSEEENGSSLGEELRRLHRRVRIMKSLGIDERDWSLLIQVAVAGEGGISVKSAAYALDMPLSSLTRRATALVCKGLLKRWDDEVDARRSFLGITTKALTSLQDYAAVTMHSSIS
jgi:CheY-like chemotaxis protein